MVTYSNHYFSTKSDFYTKLQMSQAISTVISSVISENENQNKQLKAALTNVLALEKDNKEKEANIKSLNDLVASQRTTIEQNSVRVSTLQRELDALKKEVKDLNSKLECTIKEKQESIKMVNAIKSRLTEIESKNKRLTDMLQQSRTKERKAIDELRIYMDQYIDSGVINTEQSEFKSSSSENSESECFRENVEPNTADENLDSEVILKLKTAFT